MADPCEQTNAEQDANQFQGINAIDHRRYPFLDPPRTVVRAVVSISGGATSVANYRIDGIGLKGSLMLPRPSLTHP
jgi:hypothetical protein